MAKHAGNYDKGLINRVIRFSSFDFADRLSQVRRVQLVAHYHRLDLGEDDTVVLCKSQENVGIFWDFYGTIWPDENG